MSAGGGDGNCIHSFRFLLRPVKDSVHWRQHCFLGEGGSLCLPVDIVILIMVAAVIGLCLPSGGAGVAHKGGGMWLLFACSRLDGAATGSRREQGRADPGGENS